jgi:myo-inositol-1-phosphate synthase
MRSIMAESYAPSNQSADARWPSLVYARARARGGVNFVNFRPVARLRVEG